MILETSLFCAPCYVERQYIELWLAMHGFVWCLVQLYLVWNRDYWFDCLRFSGVGYARMLPYVCPPRMFVGHAAGRTVFAGTIKALFRSSRVSQWAWERWLSGLWFGSKSLVFGHAVMCFRRGRGCRTYCLVRALFGQSECPKRVMVSNEFLPSLPQIVRRQG